MKTASAPPSSLRREASSYAWKITSANQLPEADCAKVSPVEATPSDEGATDLGDTDKFRAAIELCTKSAYWFRQ